VKGTNVTPTIQARALSHAPLAIRFSGPLVNLLLRFRTPLGPNKTVIMYGRNSGRRLEVPLAIMEFRGRRFIIGTFGETNWVRNLRARPEAEVRSGGRTTAVRARELDDAATVEFFRESLTTYLGELPLIGRVFGRVFLGLTAPAMLNDPVAAAARHPVFELLPAD
jgi:deazaflavin-dependent oxidoreductase (nitroreductase family)